MENVSPLLGTALFIGFLFAIFIYNEIEQRIPKLKKIFINLFTLPKKQK
jgi:hypothetical protein